MVKNMLKSRTLWTNAMLLVVSIAAIFGVEIVLPPALQPSTPEAVAMVSVLNIALRFVTKTALSRI